MANPQAQANGEQESTAAASAKKQVRPKPPKQTSRWRDFWDSRSKVRTRGALILMLLALVAAIYLSLPDNYQAQVVAVIQAVGQALGATGLRIGVVVALALSMGASLALWLSPVSRANASVTRALNPLSTPTTAISDYVDAEGTPTDVSGLMIVEERYPQPASIFIPSVSVYLDAENIVSEKQIPNFLNYLRTALDGRRADLLYFVDFWDNPRNTYKILSRYGFVPVHSAHNPTGMKDMYEAVDRDLATHAFMRGLLGPAKQEFIIISNDGDYAPLISRLLAQGHSVRMWSALDSTPYIALKEFVRAYPDNAYEFTNIAEFLGEPSTEQHPAELRDETRPDAQKKRKQNHKLPMLEKMAKRARIDSTILKWVEPHIEQPKSLSLEGQKRLYYAIAATLYARQYCENRYTPNGDLPPDAEKARVDRSRNGEFNRLLGTRQSSRVTLASRMADVGYEQGSKVEFWRLHLTTIGVLASVPDARFPDAGEVTAEEGAQRLFAMAVVVADAAKQVKVHRPDKKLSIDSIAAQLSANEHLAQVNGDLASLIKAGNGRSSIHVRYLVNCSKAVGIMDFDETFVDQLMSNPRLTSLGQELIANIPADQPDAPGATE